MSATNFVSQSKGYSNIDNPSDGIGNSDSPAIYPSSYSQDLDGDEVWEAKKDTKVVPNGVGNEKKTENEDNSWYEPPKPPKVTPVKPADKFNSEWDDF
jgi:hypothetical protein